MQKILNNKKILKVFYIIFSIIFVIPSIRYLIENKTVLGFDKWFKFLLEDSNIEKQTLYYLILLTIITIIFILIIKNREKIFKDIKGIIIFSSIVGAIYIFAIPFTCSDIFYYMGVGRIDAKYNQNPYKTTIKDYADNNKDKLEYDTVLKQGNLNDWSNTTVVYGPIWQLVCKVTSVLSFGNVDVGLLIFKIINLIMHIINGYLIYKITGRKIFSLLYLLNPFVLIEGIMCVHNDIFVAFFILLSLFFILKKKNLTLSVISLALAAGIKYFAILLLPYIIIYYYRKEKPLKRFLKCIQYGGVFAITLIIPFLLYVHDLNILQGMITQQGKIAKSIYLIIMQYFPQISINLLSKMLLECFAIIYFFACIVLLNAKNISFKKLISNYNIFLLAFIFLLITQFQPWYLIWLLPTCFWLNARMIKLMIGVGIIAEFANSVFLLYSEAYINGIPFIFILFTATFVTAFIIDKRTISRKMKCLKRT